MPPSDSLNGLWINQPNLQYIHSCLSSSLVTWPIIACFTLTLGPLNHLWASMANQSKANNMGAPYTRLVQFILEELRIQSITFLLMIGLWRTYLRLLPIMLGKHNIGTIKTTNATAAAPIGLPSFPRCQGPLRNLLPTKKTRKEMGIVNATKEAMAPTEKMARIATSPANIRRQSRMPTAQLNHTALTGVLVYLFTFRHCLDMGKQPSRA